MRRLNFQLVSFFALFAVLTFAARTASAAPGDLDPTFGDGGKVTNENIAPARKIVVQSDKKILVLVGEGFGGYQTIARYNHDGTLDTNFGVGGILTLSFSVPMRVSDIALQPNGKIVLVGSTPGNPDYRDNGDLAVARLNKNGTSDTTFDFDGIAIRNFNPSTLPYQHQSDSASSVVIQPDGKIIAGGRTGNETDESQVVARFNLDGSYDGAAVYGRQRDSRIFDLALQPDGKILVASLVGAWPVGSMTVYRINSDLSFDLSFGQNGRQFIFFEETEQEIPVGIDVQPDRKIVVAGYGRGSYSSSIKGIDFLLARLNPDGSLDASFGNGGKVATDFSTGPTSEDGFDIASSFVLQPDGKLVVAGYTAASAAPNEPSTFALARYNSDGQLDSGFGAGGKVITDFGANRSRAFAMALQADGKLVVGGSTLNSNTGNLNIALARYQNNVKLTVSAFRLTTIDGQFIRTLTNNAVLSASELAQYGELVIEVVTSPALVGSVYINADFDKHVENNPPYTTVSFTLGTGSWQDLSVGPHKLIATPYGRANKTGFKGTSRTLNFTVTY